MIFLFLTFLKTFIIISETVCINVKNRLQKWRKFFNPEKSRQTEYVKNLSTTMFLIKVLDTNEIEGIWKELRRLIKQEMLGKIKVPSKMENG